MPLGERSVGRLKIFFGYASGVGKTYAMLESARRAKAAGVDVAVGHLAPHTRPETLALLEGLEVLPPLEAAQGDGALRQFDLDGALARGAALLVVDELAYTNEDACRHRKRYQDIQELLHAGVDVYTTVNVQHIESLNDIVAAITGVVVRERVPDSVFDDADQVELVDIEPDDLLARLDGGEAAPPHRTERASDCFFTRENLVALREIALRRTADRLNRGKERSFRADGGVKFADEHILICLSPAPSNTKVIRTAARMAEAFHGVFTALFVETPDFSTLPEEGRSRLRENLRLAEQLGARIATLYGEDVPAQIAEYAQISGVSKIVIGRANTVRSLPISGKTLVERLTALAPNLDIYVIPDAQPPYRPRRRRLRAEAVRLSAWDLIKALGILVLCTLAGYFFFYCGFRDANIITVYILGVLFIALVTQGYLYSGVASMLSVLIFNFCFTDPYFTFRFNDTSYWVTFFIMFLSAVITSTLTMRVKRQAKLEAMKSYRTQVLLETSQVLQRAEGRQEILTRAAEQLCKLLERPVFFYPAQAEGLGAPLIFTQTGAAADAAYTAPDEQAVARWVFKNNKRAGAGTATLPGARCLYMAVRNHESVFAVVGLAMDRFPEPAAFERNLLASMLSEIALALEKEQASESKKRIEVQAHQEQLRADLLRAISHDLRTPLTSISGNASILMADHMRLPEEKRQRLYTDIYDDAMWLVNLVENLLSVTRIENGSMRIRQEPELVSEVMAEALAHVNRRAREYRISTRVSDDLLMARMDSRLILQVILNIVDNAMKYTPPGSAITLSAFPKGKLVCIEIADDGPGIPDEVKARIFEMFFTGSSKSGDSRRGLGLGLALCKSIILSHGGSIGVRDNVPHGSVFYFTLEAEEVTLYE